MDDALSRRLAGEVEPPDEPKGQGSDMSNLGEQMVGGLAGLRALHASGWEPHADLEWQDDEKEWLATPTVQQEATESRIDTRTLAIAAGVFLLAALPRLFVLFFVTDPQNPGLGWYGDTFHHWQIAILSKEIGFAEGFLRLWDFKGLEFFWGLLHPLVLIGLFNLTGSVSIVIPRLVSAIGASITMVMFFFLLRRYFNVKVAVAGVLLAIVNPVAIFSDGIGMQEPLGLIFLLGGLLLWPKRVFWTGFCYAIAGTVRAEYWIFGAGLMIVALIIDRSWDRKIALAMGWLLPSLAYAKYLLDWTGNPIYPVYWNFMGNAAGEWMVEAPLTPDRVIARWTARIVLVIAGAAAIWIFRNRRQYSAFILLGLGNFLFLAMMWGFSSYIHGFIPRFIYDRLMVVPYLYIGFFIAIGLFYYLPKYRGGRALQGLGWIAVVAIAAVSQIAWVGLMGYYDGIRPIFEEEKLLAQQIAEKYEGGTIAIPEDRPAMVYALIEYHGIEARNLIGQMYDPFSYMSGDPFIDWGQNRNLLADWFTRNDIQLLVYDVKKGNYNIMVDLEREWFHRLGSGFRDEIKIYEVNVG